MNISNLFKQHLPAATPAEQLGEIQHRLRQARSDLDGVDGAIADLALAELEGDTDATASRAELLDRRAELRQVIETLQQAERDRAGAAFREEQDADRAQQETRYDRAAELIERSLGIDDDIVRWCESIAQAIRNKHKVDLEIGNLLNSTNLLRTVQFNHMMIRNGVEGIFRIDRNGPSRAENNLLGLVSTQFGEARNQSLKARDQHRFDNVTPYYRSMEAAHEARHRLAATGCYTMVVQLTGTVWTLVPAERGQSAA